MITGDAEAVAKTVAEDYARVLPQDKAALIRKLKAEQPIAFVGDGINDAAALTEADLGLAIGAGYNVIGIPLAAGIAAPFDIVLSPAVGAILMSISTVVVSINPMLLRRVRLHD